MGTIEFLANCKNEGYVKSKIKERAGVVGPYPRKRSYYYLEWDKGEIEYVADICYQGMRGFALTKCVVWHPWHAECVSFVNAVLNCKWVGEIFLTKDYQEGVENGIHIDVEKPSNLIRGGLIFLRSCFEHEEVPLLFNRLRNLGCSVSEALYFSSALICDREGIDTRKTGHGVVCSSYVLYRDFKEGTHYHYTNPASYNCSPSALVDRCFHQCDYVDNVSKILEKICDTKEGMFGTVYELENTDENLLRLIHTYKKEYSIA